MRPFIPVLSAMMLFAAVGGAELIYSADYDAGLPSGTTVTGAAGAESGYVRLTSTVNSQVGTLLLPAPGKALPTYHFYCDLFIGGGASPAADGVCFSYGAIADGANFTEAGTGSGLELRIRTYTNRMMELVYNGAVLASWNWADTDDPLIHTNTWVPVEIMMMPDGRCTVFHNRTLRFDRVLVSGWNPQGSWRVGVGARTGGAVDNHRVDNVRVTTSEPYVTAISRASASPVGGATASVGYTVTFSEPVNNLDSADFSLTAVSGTPSAAIGAISSAGVSAAETFSAGAGIGAFVGGATVSGGYLHLTEAVNGQSGGWAYTPPRALAAFHAAFSMNVGGGTGADGCWFAYDPAAGALSGTEGPASFTGLYINFDTYDNGGETTPDISVKYNGVTYAVVKQALRENVWRNVTVTVTADGLCTILYDSRPIVADLPLSGWNPQNTWKFGFAGYTGGLNDHHYIDNFIVTDNVHTVTLNSLAGAGLIRLNLNAASVLDKYGAGITPNSFTGGQTYEFDYVAPVIALSGSSPASVECSTAYSDAGATASDNRDGDITASITTVNPVNTAVPNAYTVTYNVSDALGNAATQVTRTVNVVDTAPPVVTITGGNTLSGECGAALTLPGATGLDSCSGVRTAAVSDLDGLNAAAPAAGVYDVVYSATDAKGNAGTATLTVTVSDTTAPVVNITGGNSLSGECGQPLTLPGATATDTCDGTLAAAVSDLDGLNDAAPAAGVYHVVYSATDAKGNTGTATLTVTVTDTAAPVVTITGGASTTAECGVPLTLPGATALDACDGTLAAAVSDLDGLNDVAPAVGVYHVVYSAADAAGGTGTATLTVTVGDTAAPVITIPGPNPAHVVVGSAYTVPTATAVDACDGDLGSLSGTGPVDANTVGSYTVTYAAQDAALNQAQETLTVSVDENMPPVITLLGDAAATVNCGGTYTDAGATAQDDLEGDISSSIAVDGLPPAGTPLAGGDVYTVTYTVSDALGNAAAPVTRTVTVLDNCTLQVTADGPTDLTVVANGRAEMAVSVSGAVGTPVYQWLFDPAGGGKALSALPGATRATLVIDPVTNADAGSYACEVADDVTTVLSPAFTLTVGTGVPLAGLPGLAALAAALGAGGAALQRRRRQ